MPYKKPTLVPPRQKYIFSHPINCSLSYCVTYDAGSLETARISRHYVLESDPREGTGRYLDTVPRCGKPCFCEKETERSILDTSRVLKQVCIDLCRIN